MMAEVEEGKVNWGEEVDLSGFTKGELAIIEQIKENERPLTRFWVLHYLSQAHSVYGPNL